MKVSVTVTGFLILLSLFTFAQRGIVNNGAKISVSSGALIKISGTEANYTNNTSGGFDGRIDLDGVIKLSGNWNNNATAGGVFINVGTNGEVVFEGTTQQSILGNPTNFEKVTINNLNDVALSTDISVNGDFTFTNGNMILGANNLTLSTTSTIIGTPSASKMFVANGAGELRKSFAANGSFTFPVGDNSGTIEYSPVTLSFTSGTYGVSAYAGVKLVNAKHPNNSSPLDYINRYWTISQSNISGFSCDITGTYLDADIVGTEANMFTARWDMLDWYKLNAVATATNQVSGSVSEFGDFTAGEQAMFCNPPVSIVSNPTNTTCIGGSDGAIDITVSDTVPTVVFNWATTGGSGLINGIEDQSGLTEGIYNVTVTDGNGCSATDAITITYDHSVTANAGADDDLCPGQTTVQLSASGGTTYAWSPATGLSDPNIYNPIANPSATTTYTVTVTDAFGCSNTDNVIVTVNTLPTADAGLDNTICNGESATLDASGSSGTPTLLYSWDNGLGAGVTHVVSPTVTTTYTVTVTDGNTCTATASTIITVNDLPVVYAGADQSIPNGTNTLIDATVSGGSGTYSYDWSPGTLLVDSTIVDPTTVNLSTTTSYILSVTDAVTNCSNTDTVVITVTGGPLSASPYASSSTICNGESTQIFASPSGGSGTYTFSWTSVPAGFTSALENPSVSPTVTTTYTVVVDDGFNTASASVTVTVNDLPVANAGTDDAVCLGNSTTIDASGSSGTPTLSYNWDNGLGAGVSQTVTPTVTTTYTVTVTDGNNCSSTDAVVVTVNDLPVANAGTDDAVCLGSSITIDASGSTGVPTLSYTWDNGLGAGVSHTVSPSSNTTYTVTVTDGNNCSNTDAVFITVNSLPVANAGTDKIICEGETTTISATGGSSYNWDNGLGAGATHTVSPVTTTTYTVTVTDANNCTDTDAVIVNVNPLPAADAGTDLSVCEGESVTLTATGGTTYSWDNGINQGVAFVPTTTTTTYTVTVTDANGCSNTDSVIVNVNTLPVAYAGADETICETETVTLTATGGTSYEWSTTETTSSISVTPSTTTTYTVTVTGSNGCTSTDDVIVNVNPLPVADAGTDQSVCEGGSVTLTASGGNTYAWSDGVTQGVAFVPVATNTYTVTVTDANGCTDTDNTIVTVLINPVADAGVDQTVCDGESVTLIATGGVSYTWNNGVTQAVPFYPSITDTYIVTATGSNGCTDVDSVIVNVNPLPPVYAGTDQAVCDGESAVLTATGGDSYEWSTTETTSTITVTPVSTTTYYVTATDVNGCTAIDNVVVTVNALPVADAGADQAICDGESVTLTATGGDTYTWDNGVTQSVPFNPAATATYSVTVTDANGCTGTDSVTVVVNPLPVADAGTDQVICEGESVTLTATGGDTYTWNNGVTQGVPFNPVATATYSVTVTDANACSSTDTVIVTVNSVPLVDAGTDLSIAYGTSTLIDATVSGGSGSYYYDWSPLDSLIDATVVDPTTINLTASTLFTLLVTDSVTGCQASSSMTVTVTGGPLVVSPYAIPDTICEGESIQLFAMPSGGSGTYSFSWTSVPAGFTSVDENPFDTPTTTTTYYVVVNDGSNTDTASVTVTVNPVPVADAGQDTTICQGESITLTATGGTNYVWDNSVVQGVAFSPVVTNMYSVTVTNSYSCSSTDNVVVTVNSAPLANAGADQIICEGDSVVLSATGGTTYTWNNGVIQDVYFMPTVTQTYIVTVEDTNACTSVDSVTVTVNPLPVADAGADQIVCEGESVTLTATGGGTYTWSGGVTQGATFTPVSTTMYYVTVTNTQGCYDVDSVLITVNPLPVADAGNDTTVCEGESVTLTATGGDTYTWSGGISQGVAFVPLTTDVYTVTVTDINGCTAVANATVTVNSLPLVDAGVDMSIPYLTSTLIDATVTGGSGSYIYDWSPMDSLVDNTIVDPTTINLHATTMFVLLVTDAVTGCQNTDTMTVSITGGPLFASPYVSTDTVCEGDMVQMFALPSGGTGTYTYSWTAVPAGFASSSENPVDYPVVSTTYILELNDGVETFIDSVSVFVNPLPVVDLGLDTILCSYDTLILDAGAGYVSYMWSTGETTQTIVLDSTDAWMSPVTFSVTVVDNNGCENSDIIDVMFDICGDVDDVANNLKPEMLIYPNPSDGKVFVSYKGFSKDIILTIYDVDGRMVYNEKIQSVNKLFTKSIDLTGYAEGSYTLRVISDDFVKIERLVLYK